MFTWCWGLLINCTKNYSYVLIIKWKKKEYLHLSTWYFFPSILSVLITKWKKKVYLHLSTWYIYSCIECVHYIGKDVQQKIENLLPKLFLTFLSLLEVARRILKFNKRTQKNFNSQICIKLPFQNINKNKSFQNLSYQNKIAN